MAAAFPAQSIPNSSVDQQFAFAKRVTARLLLSAAEVVCSYPQKSGEEALRPSPLLGGLVGQAVPPVDANHRPAPLEELTHDPAPPLGDNRYVRGGMSVIADQSACNTCIKEATLFRGEIFSEEERNLSGSFWGHHVSKELSADP